MPKVQWQPPSEFTLDPSQTQALDTLAQSPLSLLIGGPGRGKTTLIKTIAEAAQKHNYHLLMCAPTGRAAQRLQESTGVESYTIHRLMYSMTDERFDREQKKWIFIYG